MESRNGNIIQKKIQTFEIVAKKNLSNNKLF